MSAAFFPGQRDSPAGRAPRDTHTPPHPGSEAAGGGGTHTVIKTPAPGTAADPRERSPPSHARSVAAPPPPPGGAGRGRVWGGVQPLPGPPRPYRGVAGPAPPGRAGPGRSVPRAGSDTCRRAAAPVTAASPGQRRQARRQHRGGGGGEPGSKRDSGKSPALRRESGEERGGLPGLPGGPPAGGERGFRGLAPAFGRFVFPALKGSKLD